MRYLFDWSVPVNCPELLQGFRMPKYFAQDYLQHTKDWLLGATVPIYPDFWPSLLIGEKHTKSPLHMDALGTNFWMVRAVRVAPTIV
jgi:hypothetical protein